MVLIDMDSAFTTSLKQCESLLTARYSIIGLNELATIVKQIEICIRETKMIIISPLARGESHHYLPEESIQEIIEVTDKMIELFSRPKEKIVLGGYSTATRNPDKVGHPFDECLKKE